MNTLEIHVVAGVIRDTSGRVLIAQRPRGRHMAGRWEFPGGKLHPGESPLQGLRRELAEELGVVVSSGERLIMLRHDYPDRRVLLDAWSVTAHEGTPRGLESQALAWVAPEELPGHDLLEADRAIVTALRLPRLAMVMDELPALPSPAPARREAQLWRFRADASVPEAGAVSALRRSRRPVFVLGEGAQALHAAVIMGAEGVIVTWGGRGIHIDPDSQFLVGVQCRDAESCHAAAVSGAHFLLLAPDKPVTEAALEDLCRTLGLPIWIGWYASDQRLARLRQSGAHGCAIRLPATALS